MKGYQKIIDFRMNQCWQQDNAEIKKNQGVV